MPNLEAAAALIPDAEPTDSSDSEQSTSDIISEAIAEGVAKAAGETTEQASEPNPEATDQQSDTTNPAELRAQEMRERIARLKAQNAERAETRRLETLKSEVQKSRVEAERAAAEAAAKREAETARWQAALKNPIAGFKELGLSPEDAYRQITEAVLEEEKPERAQAKLVEKLLAERLKEIEPKLSKLSELEQQLEAFKQLEAERSQAAMRAQNVAAEQEFLKTVRSNGYETLADYYDDDELTHLGHALANEFIAQNKPVSFEGVASELQRRLEAQLKRAEERRAKRLGSPSEEQSSKAKPQPGQPASQAKTLTNQLSSSSATATTKQMTRQERLLKAEQLLHALEKR